MIPEALRPQSPCPGGRSYAHGVCRQEKQGPVWLTGACVGKLHMDRGSRVEQTSLFSYPLLYSTFITKFFCSASSLALETMMCLPFCPGLCCVKAPHPPSGDCYGQVCSTAVKKKCCVQTLKAKLLPGVSATRLPRLAHLDAALDHQFHLVPGSVSSPHNKAKTQLDSASLPPCACPESSHP